MVARTMLGAIDAGSNAIRFMIGELTPEGLARREADRVPVRLGHGAFTRGELDERTIDQAVVAFEQFRRRFDHHGVGAYRAVATSAVRHAANRDVLTHRLYHEAGIELQVIDGDEEARLVRKAVLTCSGAGQAPRCILDLGGGSLEVNLRAGAAWRGTSLPVGTVRLLESFGLDGAIGEAEAAMVRRYTATLMQTVGHRGDLGVASATGGNADALARIFGNGAAPPAAGPAGDLIPGFGAAAAPAESPSFELAALERGLPALLAASVEERMARHGVKRDRAEVLGVAALVFATVARQLGVTRMIAPGVGIRDALLIELAEAAADEQPLAEGAHDKALLTAARDFAGHVDHDTTHGEHVRQLARALFHQLRDVHGLPEQLGVVLEVAALLHDVGEVVNPRGHHKHSEYMIRWGRIPGLEGDARELVALMVRGHRKDAARVRQLVAEAPLAKEQRGHLRRLTALLRVADGLDCQHRSRIEHVVCTRMGSAVVLDLVVRDGPSRDDAQLLRKADLFREEFGVDLRVTVARPVVAPFEPGTTGPIPVRPG